VGGPANDPSPIAGLHLYVPPSVNWTTLLPFGAGIHLQIVNL